MKKNDKNLSKEYQWEVLKDDVLVDKKDVIIDKVVLAALIKKIDDLEKKIEFLEMQDTIYHGVFC